MFLLAAALITSPTAFAQDEDSEDSDTVSEDEDEGSSKKKSKKKSSGRKESAGKIREIVRGVYAKADVGGAGYLLGLKDSVQAGTLVGLGVGQDFVDNEKQSMAWEVNILQGIHNGGAAALQTSPDIQCPGGPAVCTEGDLRTYSLQASYEFSAYPTRRIGIGFRVGAGAMYSPLLIDATAYNEEIIPSPAYGGADPGFHGGIHPYGFGGPAFEYYTKLSHFSVGINADVFYAVGWDLGLNGAGSLKYTF